MLMMKVNGLYINLDACPYFNVTQDGDDVRISVSDYNYTILKNVTEQEVYRAVAYKTENDPRNFELIKTIMYLRRVADGD